MRRVRPLPLALAAALCAGGATPAAAGAQDVPAAIVTDFRQDGRVAPCDHSAAEVRRALDELPADADVLTPDLRQQLEASSEAHTSGRCRAAGVASEGEAGARAPATPRRGRGPACSRRGDRRQQGPPARLARGGQAHAPARAAERPGPGRAGRRHRARGPVGPRPHGGGRPARAAVAPARPGGGTARRGARVGRRCARRACRPRGTARAATVAGRPPGGPPTRGRTSPTGSASAAEGPANAAFPSFRLPHSGHSTSP
jgi:hypothetical protein